MPYVYVLDTDGHPLMPTHPVKARKLLKTGKAEVAKRTPFTIRLTYQTGNRTQDITLGIDAGSRTIGMAAVSGSKVLFAAEVYPRNDVVSKLSTRREFRRSRRNRKTRYRKPRFNNRVRSKHKGWLAPSVEVKIQEHITGICMACRILPITKVIVETAEFDLQKIKAIETGKPLPEGTDYQQGEMLGFYNVRQYVLHRDGYRCVCYGHHADRDKGVKLHVHHLESRKTGGDTPGNLVTLCKECHKRVHKGTVRLPEKLRKRRPTRDAAFMGIMRKTTVSRLKSVLDIPIAETHGYITKYIRTEQLKLPKTHINDAIAITIGIDSDIRSIRNSSDIFLIKPVRHHNRQLHRSKILKGGIRKNNQAPRYVKGFKLFDKVLYHGTECFVYGRRTSGGFLLKDIDGNKIKDGANWKHLKLLEKGSNYIIQQKERTAVHPYA